MSKTNKPAQPIRLPSQTKEEQEMQIARFLANKKESFFQLILANLLQNESVTANRIAEMEDGHLRNEKVDIKAVIDLANEGADYALTKLYPVQKKED